MNERRRLFCFLSGLAIALLVSLFVIFGTNLMLRIIRAFDLPTQALVIYTSIFYGIIFFIARASVPVNRRPLSLQETEEGLLDEGENPPKKRPAISLLLTILWVLFGIFSVLWVTPALVIYWSSPIYPDKITALLALIFGLASAAIYFALKNERFHSILDRLLFLGGTCLGLSISVWIIS
jgi:hypothetical protein